MIKRKFDDRCPAENGELWKDLEELRNSDKNGMEIPLDVDFSIKKNAHARSLEERKKRVIRHFMTVGGIAVSIVAIFSIFLLGQGRAKENKNYAQTQIPLNEIAGWNSVDMESDFFALQSEMEYNDVNLYINAIESKDREKVKSDINFEMPELLI